MKEKDKAKSKDGIDAVSQFAYLSYCFCEEKVSV